MKLSKRVIKIIAERQHTAEWCAKIAARIEADDPTLADHFTRTGHTEEYYYGLRDGAHSVIESLLMAHGSYRGYSEQLCDETDANWNHYL